MHELSIVISIVDIAKAEAEKLNISSFSTIELEIGSQSGIVQEALDFAWLQGVKESVLNSAKRKIDWVEAKAKCQDCGAVFAIANLYDTCPHCNSLFNELIQGKELKIKALTYED